MNGTTTTSSPSNRIDVIDGQGGRILCVADVRGKLSTLNELAKEYNAQAIIHTGDFGFYEPASLSKITDRTLKHLIQYSMAVSPELRQNLNSPNLSPHQLRQMLVNPHQPTLEPSSATSNSAQSSHFALSEFPKLLTGELKFNVPVYAVWGACEDVSVLERLRVAPPGPLSFNAPAAAAAPAISQQPNWSIPNLTVLSESSTRVLVVGGVRFRLFGLGGACVAHKMFDNGEGQATIAGGGGTMWTTILQIGELVDTAARVYDPAETRILVTHASPGREGILAQLALALKADITVSASLHFRYGVSYNEFSTHHDQEAYKNKFLFAKASFDEIWSTVKPQVESVIDEGQRKFLNNALAVTSRVPGDAASGNQGQVEEAAWKNTWNWNLPDANFGSLILDVRDGRVSAEQRSQGFNFSYRAGAGAPAGPPNKAAANVAQPTRPPSAPRVQQQSQQSQQQPRGNFGPNQSKPYQQNRDQPFRKENRRDQNKSVASETSSKPPTDAPARSDSPAAAKTNETAKDKEQQATSPQIDRPASSASSRRSSHHKAKSFSAEDAKPSAPPAEGQAESDGSHRGRGGRGGNRGARGGRGGFDGKPSLRGGRGRGGRFEGQQASENRDATNPSPAPAAPAPASASAPAAPTPASTNDS